MVVKPAVITSIESKKRVRNRSLGRSAAAGSVWFVVRARSGYEFKTRSANELVSHAVYRAEMYRTGWVSFQFLAKFENVVIDRAG